MKERHHGMIRTGAVLVLLALLLGYNLLRSEAADTLPAQLSDAEFWRIVTDFSEPNGDFPFENFVSNEYQYQDIIAKMKTDAPPGGVYIGVAPEQNFTYIAALQPRMAFILDIRRQNMLELLLYKALFEMSKDRAEFVSRLFARKCPPTVNEKFTAKELFDACAKSQRDPEYYRATLQTVRDRLIKQHQFKFAGDDELRIGSVFNVFFSGGPEMDYLYASPTRPTSRSKVPTYQELMTVADPQGRNWSYLEKEDAYQRVRAMQLKNLIVPIVGDFGGPRALKSIGGYVKDHRARVSVFYLSNVEDYLQAKWTAYRANIAALPVENTSLFVRVYIYPPRTALAPINTLPVNYPGRTY